MKHRVASTETVASAPKRRSRRFAERIRRRLFRAIALSAALLPGAPCRADAVTAALETERPRPYVHEVIALTITVRSAGKRLGQQMELAGMPSEDVLRLVRVEPLPMTHATDPAAGAEEIRRFRLVVHAEVAGSILIEPSLRVTVLDKRPDAPTGSEGIERPQVVGVQPLTLSAVPLPREGQPPGFSGAVGQFRLQVRAHPTEVAAGELVTLMIGIAGRGYLDDLVPPGIPEASGFSLHNPRAVPPRNPTYLLAYEQALAPQTTNVAAIPAVTFSFFDPVLEAYLTATQGPFRLNVLGPSALQTATPKPAAGTTGRLRLPGTVLDLLLVLYGVLACGLAAWLAARARGGGVMAAILLMLAAGVLFHAYSQYCTLLARGLTRATAAHADVARFAPSTEALAVFEVPDRAAVRIVNMAGEWVEVEFRGRRGWFPVAALDRR